MADRAPVYLLSGDDEHLLRRATERVLRDLRATVGTVGGELDVEHLDAAELEGLPDLRTASLFGGDRCVVLRRLEAAGVALRRELDEYVDDPDPDVTLVVVAHGGNVQALANRVQKSGELVQVRAPAPWDDRGWADLVADELREHGRTAEDAAVAALLDHAGTDPTAIASKVAQVVAGTPETERVTASDVERLVEGHGNRGGFVVADAVEERDPGAALVALRGALEAGEQPLAILGALTFRLRRVVQVRAGAPRQEVGISTGQYRRLQHVAQRFAPGELAWCHDRLARADLELKGSDLPGEVLLELAVVDLATSREVGRPWNPAAAT